MISPAVWALTGLFISMVAITAFILMVYVLLYLVFLGLAWFGRGLVQNLFPKWHD